MTIRKLAIGLTAILLSQAALAVDAVVTWTNPTTNTDGSAIPATGAGSLTQTRVEYGTCSGTAFGTVTGSVTVPAPAATVTIPGFAAGQVSCFRAFSRNTYGNESATSNVAVKTFPTPTPNPPVLGAVSTVAYEINMTPSGLVKLGRDVGNLALGTACSEDVIVANNHGTYFSIPTSAVTLYRTPKSSVLVTECNYQKAEG